MEQGEYIIGLTISDGNQLDTMATLTIGSEHLHMTGNDNYMREARHGLAAGLRMMADKLDEYEVGE